MINYKWDVYQFVSGFELRSLFFIRFFFIQLFLHPLFSLPIFTFHFKCGCILYCMKSNSFQFEMITCISVVRRTISVILSAPLQSFTCETNNKKPYCIQHDTTNREYHHQLIWYWTWLCISIQQWNRKNSLERIQIPAIKKQQRHQQPFRLSFLDWEVCKNTSYCFLSIRIYAHITYTYCMEMRPFMLNQRMWSVPHCRSKG